ncbi:unnamed protein product [Linum trigynum]|uniref:DUF659 domain-containing protein n=1 Tax=Linum trigynum TaxID=586398 RepID=A0AAV2D853_9ROSI
MEQTEATVTASAVENANSLKRKSDDIGWEYGKLGGGGVAKRRSCPNEAKLACLKWLGGTVKKKQYKVIRELGLRSDVNVSSGGQQEEDLTCAGSSEPHKLGPIDKWARAIDPNLSSNASFQQQKIDQALFSERTLQVHQYIAKWVYTHVHASNNMEAKALLLKKRPNIFLSSCATHTVNLMLQGINNIPRLKKIVDQAKGFTIFIYGHHRTLECMRSFTKKRETIRPGVTQFASQFLTLQSLLDKKDSLRKMVMNAMWENIKETSSKKGKEAYDTVLSVRLLNGVEVCLKVFEPLVKLLRLVDGDVKPSMGFVYGELLKAKREINEAFKNEELCYKEVIAIVEKKMRGRLDAPLHLTTYLLNPHYRLFGKKMAKNCVNFDYNPG